MHSSSRPLQLSDNQPDDKSKKKKRLDDIMFGLGAAKGVQLEAAAKAAAAAAAAKQGDEAAAQSLLKRDLGKTADLSKLQEMLGPADAKVQKWLADQGRHSIIGLNIFSLFQSHNIVH